MSEEHKRLSTIIRDIHLAFDEATEQMNTHSQDQCNEALYYFYNRVATIFYKPMKLAASPKETDQ